MVVFFARRYVGRGVDYLDLIQEGNLGLLRAIEKFDVNRGVRLSVYAEYWIRQRMIRSTQNIGREIRIPENVNAIEARINRARAKLECFTSEEILEEDIMKETGMEKKDFESIKERMELVEMIRRSIPLDMVLEVDDDGYVVTFEERLEDTRRENTEAQLDVFEMREGLDTALDHLAKRKEDIVRKLFGLDTQEERTLRSMADEYSLSTIRIAMLRDEALEEIKFLLRKDYSNYNEKIAVRKKGRIIARLRRKWSPLIG